MCVWPAPIECLSDSKVTWLLKNVGISASHSLWSCSVTWVFGISCSTFHLFELERVVCVIPCSQRSVSVLFALHLHPLNPAALPAPLLSIYVTYSRKERASPNIPKVTEPCQLKLSSFPLCVFSIIWTWVILINEYSSACTRPCRPFKPIHRLIPVGKYHVRAPYC